MKTLTLKLPDTVDVELSDVLMMVAARLYERGTLSMGQAADLAGRTRVDFMEMLGSYGVSIFSSPLSEIESDVQRTNGNDCADETKISRSERFERLRGSLRDQRIESLTIEDFKAERREVWKGLVD